MNLLMKSFLLEAGYLPGGVGEENTEHGFGKNSKHWQENRTWDPALGNSADKGERIYV